MDKTVNRMWINIIPALIFVRISKMPAMVGLVLLSFRVRLLLAGIDGVALHARHVVHAVLRTFLILI